MHPTEFSHVPDRNGPIKRQYELDRADREIPNRQAEQLAEMVSPMLFPPSGTQPGTRYKQPYTSVGAISLNAMVGRDLAITFQTDEPWIDLSVTDDVRGDVRFSDASLQAARDLLSRDATMIVDVLKASTARKMGKGRQYRLAPFNSQMAFALAQLRIAGDVLCIGHEGMRIETVRRDRFTVLRDSHGSIMRIIAHWIIDAATLDPEHLAKADLPADTLNKPAEYRTVSMYMKHEYNPDTGMYMLTYECGGNTIYEKAEKVPSVWVASFGFVPGEHYAAGQMHVALDKLQQLNFVRQRMYELIGADATILFGIQPGSMVRDTDLTKKSGSVTRNVRITPDGRWADVGVLSVDKTGAVNALYTQARELENDIYQLFGVKGPSLPSKERTTATQIQRIVEEADQSSAGQTSAAYESFMLPMARWALDQAGREGLLTDPGDDEVAAILDDYLNVGLRTGPSLLADTGRLNRMLQFAQIASLNPALQEAINWPVFGQAAARYTRVREPGMVKTQEDLEAERMAAAGGRVQEQAALRGVEALGSILETQAAQQPVASA
jgi:hypothetical protein